jgi:glycosyltransferase involved in cell wall biosynthesis
MIKGKIAENISFITTVFNESDSIEDFIQSLIAQTLLPSEVIVVDGGSSDSTVIFLKKYFGNICNQIKKNKNFLSCSSTGSDKKSNSNPEIIFEGSIDEKILVKIISAPGAQIARGRNIAISNCTKKIICVSDAGCILDKNWVYEITRFNDGGDLLLVTGGYNYPYARNIIQATLAICVLPKKNEINTEMFMPSSRNISFSRIIWESTGGYPEKLDFGEDMKFNFNVRSAGYEVKFNPDAEVYWNLRDNLKSIFKQFFRYAKGDAIGRMYLHRHIIRFASMVFFAGIILISIFFSPWFFLLLAPFFAFYFYRPFLRIDYVLKNSNCSIFIKSHKDLSRTRFKVSFLIPFLLIFIDTAKLSGYIYGIFARKKFK